MKTKDYKCGVYRITNIVTGESYFGISSDIERIITQHKNPSYRTFHPSALHEAMDAQGVNSFKYEVYRECEPYLMKKTQTEAINQALAEGVAIYNEGNGHKSNRGYREVSYALAAKIASVADSTYKEHNRRRGLFPYRQLNNTKAVNQIDLASGRVIKTFDSIVEAEKAFGPLKVPSKTSGSISKVCRGAKKQAFGYGWEYTAA